MIYSHSVTFKNRNPGGCVFKQQNIQYLYASLAHTKRDNKLPTVIEQTVTNRLNLNPILKARFTRTYVYVRKRGMYNSAKKKVKLCTGRVN